VFRALLNKCFARSSSYGYGDDGRENENACHRDNDGEQTGSRARSRAGPALTAITAPATLLISIAGEAVI
jgi:hypothetical protein